MVDLKAWCALLGLVSSTLAALPINALERKLGRNTISHRSLHKRDDVDPTLLYPEYNISTPIDHWHNDSTYEPHSNGMFNMRYWFDATYYKKGGPVIVLQSGETDATERLVYLQKGLLHQMIEATNGIGVVLEHRYYGNSWPTSDLSTKNLRFLTTDQALADEVYFAKNVVFKGLEHLDLRAPNVAYIGYGGSYAGAFNAFLRKLYPDVFWGTISSSGVVEAIWDYWTYYEPIRVYAKQSCVLNTQKITHMMDNILLGNDKKTKTELKAAFGLPNVTYDDDFAYVVGYGIDAWQGKNWDPEVNDPSFELYCGNITTDSIIYPETKGLESTVQDLLKKGGYGSEVNELTTPMLNWIGWLGQYIVDGCAGEQDECFSTHNATYYAQDSISDGSWRSWPYQYCTQWGFLQTGGTPKDILPLTSRLNTLEWESIVCVDSFNITTPPNVTAVNKYGGFAISYPRLAFVDGQIDPWRPATPHASPFNTTAHNRTSTVSEPFILIADAVHHWDENALFPNETVNHPPDFLPPVPVRETQAEEIGFLKVWMLEWDLHLLSTGKSARELELRQQ
ncbi:putative extracellular serine carboxypeptidase [Hyphodiscus hymeniophilus]|uniref:Extracellular serine carboxypeptidase n=1 Tax=Hyphodiscus hymeniophilus TaxID=353542 RepID=A0A9P6VGY2_9HELO|nr:putative extracellular serine carboxypeptidase [Hyphodiscus hymeniophilus]